MKFRSNQTHSLSLYLYGQEAGTYPVLLQFNMFHRFRLHKLHCRSMFLQLVLRYHLLALFNMVVL